MFGEWTNLIIFPVQIVIPQCVDGEVVAVDFDVCGWAETVAVGFVGERDECGVFLVFLDFVFFHYPVGVSARVSGVDETSA